MKLSRRYAPYVYGIIQAALTTAVATAIATWKVTGTGLLFMQHWFSAWGASWLTMIPVVLLIAPLIQRAVLRLTTPDEPPGLNPERT